MTTAHWTAFEEWPELGLSVGPPVPRYPLLIHYIREMRPAPRSTSFRSALNLTLPDEPTDDWKFELSSFGHPVRSSCGLAENNR